MAESSVLASIGSDRTFTLYDIRTGKAERRVVMQVCFHRYYTVALNAYGLLSRCEVTLYHGHLLSLPRSF